MATFDVGLLKGRAAVRDHDEPHRTATPLELLFDLTSVVGVGRAAAALHHEIVAGHVADGVVGFVTVFFAVWWAWMNFTWFASAHDSDDVAHRVLAFVQMAGAIVIAAGVTRAVEDGDFLVVTIGYAIMRVPLMFAWLRVARDHPDQRARARRYALGVAVLQVLWFARLGLDDDLGLLSFAVLAVGEMAVPFWAERAGPAPVFHAEHIEERYGLFTIIVLGESVLSATAGFQVAVDEAGLTGDLLTVGVSGLVVVFAAWWIYFDHPGHLTPTPAQAFRWGYGHVLVFASLAAFGAGVHVAAEAVTGHADGGDAAASVAVPMATYLAGVVLVMAITGTPLRSLRVLPKVAGAAVLLVVGFTTGVVVAAAVTATVMAVLALTMAVSTDRGPGRTDRPDDRSGDAVAA